jgi:hypothetical protein
VPKISYTFDDDLDDVDVFDMDFDEEERPARRSRTKDVDEPVRREKHRLKRPPRKEEDQAFKCGHCKQFIGAPLAGGRQRNHCPNCLYSRHVDDTAPGDRKSDCHALMKPIGLITRRNGEEAIVHRCLGCGKEGPNRIAADDNPVLLEQLEQIAWSWPSGQPA